MSWWTRSGIRASAASTSEGSGMASRKLPVAESSLARRAASRAGDAARRDGRQRIVPVVRGVGAGGAGCGDGGDDHCDGGDMGQAALGIERRSWIGLPDHDPVAEEVGVAHVGGLLRDLDVCVTGPAEVDAAVTRALAAR